MKKIFTKALTFALSFVMAFGLLCPVNTVLASSSDWTGTYTQFLRDMVDDVQKDREFYTRFALYDIDADGSPELFLKNTSVEGGYRIYRINGSKVTLEKTFFCTDFYITQEGELIISYGDADGNTYVYYDGELSLANSEKLFRYRRDKQDSSGNWNYIYYYKTKQITKEEYDERFKERLTLLHLSFSDITYENVDVEIYQGVGFPQDGSLTYFHITRGTFGASAQVRFGNSNTVLADDIFGLLMVNGNIVTDAFPVNVDGRTLVPVRAVSESLNAKVDWVGDIQKIIVNGNSRIEMFVDNNIALVNGEKITLDVAPQIIDGAAYVPVRFVSESLGADVYFVEGESDFLPLICIENSENAQIKGLEEDEAEDKVKELFKDIRWNSGSVFTRAYMDERITIQVDKLIANRFWSVELDRKGTQGIWVDRYTGQVFSKYNISGACGIEAGIGAVISALIDVYL